MDTRLLILVNPLPLKWGRGKVVAHVSKANDSNAAVLILVLKKVFFTSVVESLTGGRRSVA